MKRRWLLTLAAPTLLLSAPGVARADDPPGCPPGEWFCDDASGEESPEELEEGAPEDLSDDFEGSPSDDDDDRAPGSVDDERDIDVRRPAASRVTDSEWSEGSGGRSASPWALAMRLSGALLDSKGRGSDARLGGIGVSGRFAVNPVVTLDLGLDSILGTDYNGYDRSELSLSFSSLFYLNYHPVLRTYVLVGINTSRARVDIGGDDQSWGYFGGQTGLGLDIALDSRIALNVDVLAFVRGRTDSRAAREPEFTDGQGRVTNTSGGGLLRAGITLHF
jgi:hypothetical protein